MNPGTTTCIVDIRPGLFALVTCGFKSHFHARFAKQKLMQFPGTCLQLDLGQDLYNPVYIPAKNCRLHSCEWRWVCPGDVILTVMVYPQRVADLFEHCTHSVSFCRNCSPGREQVVVFLELSVIHVCSSCESFPSERVQQSNLSVTVSAVK